MAEPARWLGVVVGQVWQHLGTDDQLRVVRIQMNGKTGRCRALCQVIESDRPHTVGVTDAVMITKHSGLHGYRLLEDAGEPHHAAAPSKRASRARTTPTGKDVE